MNRNQQLHTPKFASVQWNSIGINNDDDNNDTSNDNHEIHPQNGLIGNNRIQKKKYDDDGDEGKLWQPATAMTTKNKRRLKWFKCCFWCVWCLCVCVFVWWHVWFFVCDSSKTFYGPNQLEAVCFLVHNMRVGLVSFSHHLRFDARVILILLCLACTYTC